MNRTAEVIRPGSRVRLHISIHIEDGTEVLSSFDGEALELHIGDATLAAGLENLLLGLPVGADEQILTDGALIYGEPNPELIRRLDHADLPEGFQARPGQVIAFDTPGGQETAGTVLAVSSDGIEVDFNHPLSRRGLRIRVSVLDVDRPG